MNEVISLVEPNALMTFLKSENFKSSIPVLILITMWCYAAFKNPDAEIE